MADRRQVLQGATSILALAVAGCTEDGQPTDEPTDDRRPADGQADGTPTDGTPTDGAPMDGTPTDGTDPATEAGTAATATSDRTGGDATDEPTENEPGGSQLDLREANVTAVAVEGSDGRYRFDVTLYHDDDGEAGYADWWQVESLDGDRLGRRELLHAHGTQEFTRSESIELPADIRCVVVRGHDQTHGYGGQAMLVDVTTGETVRQRQGADPRSFSATDCP